MKESITYGILLIIYLVSMYFLSQHYNGTGYEVTYHDKHVEYIEADATELAVDRIKFKINVGMLKGQKFVKSVPIADIIKVEYKKKDMELEHETKN